MKKNLPLPRVLIVEESRIVRAMIIKHIRGSYEFREEADGEAAWQILVLDQSIDLVICSLSLPVLDGSGLLTRVRASRLARLAKMPMLMISGDNEEALERAKLNGASEFIHRGTGREELLERISSLLKPAPAAAPKFSKSNSSNGNADFLQTKIFTDVDVDLEASHVMSQALENNQEVSVMAIAFDHPKTLLEQYGADAHNQLEQRFVAILRSKLRQEDSLGEFINHQLLVVSPSLSTHVCISLGERLQKTLAEASLAIQGQRLNLTISIGVSNSHDDQITSLDILSKQAIARLQEAQQRGGARIFSCQAQAGAEPLNIENALALIKSGRSSEVLPHINRLGLHLLPLLKLLSSDLQIDLALETLQKTLQSQTHKKQLP